MTPIELLQNLPRHFPLPALTNSQNKKINVSDKKYHTLFVHIIASVYHDMYRIVKTYYSTKQYAGPGYFYFILLMHQHVESMFVITFHFIAHNLYVYTSFFFIR